MDPIEAEQAESCTKESGSKGKQMVLVLCATREITSGTTFTSKGSSKEVNLK